MYRLFLISYVSAGKTAAQKHRWDELKAERDKSLREIELSDILVYKHAIETLNIPPVYIPTFRLPRPKFFRDNTISLLSEGKVRDLREKRKHNAVSTNEESDAVIPNRPTKFNETIDGWALTDQNRYIDSDYPYGKAVHAIDPIPLASGGDRVNEVLEIIPEEKNEDFKRYL